MPWLTLLLLLLLAPAAGAEPDTICLDEDVIEGNQELPRVLYILPWRELPGAPIEQPAPGAAAADWLKPIKPDDHRRTLELRQLLKTSDHRSLKEEETWM